MPKVKLEVSEADAARVQKAIRDGAAVRVEIGGHTRRTNGGARPGAVFPLLMSHTITDAQAEEARRLFGEPLALPPDLQRAWSQVNPHPDDVPFQQHLDWALSVTRPGDAVLVHGEPGMQTALAFALQETGRIPVYATTARESIDEIQPDGSIRKVAIFKHVRYRRYPSVGGPDFT